MSGKVSKIVVKNLHEYTSNEDLELFFSDIGPIKKSFVVTERGSDRCKGFGFVHFAIGEDADTAVSEYNGKTFKGKDIAIEYAKPKNFSDKKAPSNPAAEFMEKVNSSAKFSSRVIVITGLSGDTNKEWIKVICKKYGTIKKIIFPAPKNKFSNNLGECAFVLYQSMDQSAKAHRELKQKKFKNKNIQIKLYNQAAIKKFRLIVRNIPYTLEVSELEEEFSKYGYLYDVAVPPNKNKPGKNIGCGFVNYTNINDCNKAIEQGNKTKLKGRRVVVDFTVAKDIYSEVKESESESSDGDEENEDSVDVSDLSEVSEMEADSESSEEAPKKEKKPRHEKKEEVNDAEEGKTLFIRNVAYDATKDDIIEQFKVFGEVKYCLFNKDKKTGEFRGSVFLQFKEKESVEAAMLEAYRSFRFENGIENFNVNGQNYGESDIIISGRPLVICIAKPKGNVKAQDSKKEKKDKRNLHLAEVGVIKPHTKRAQKLSELERERRAIMWQEKKLKLANPNYHVSRTRLSVRGIPKNVTETQLRDLFKKAAQSNEDKSTYGPAIKQVKIVRDKENLDQNGQPKSKGFGFV
eukprot:TRINITY_DN3573_c0_g1_i1.p1 TRINITY_DN3573_c0_g1~~TRINITY_DN3573_c0_g1_i1.p1  ORF type:complete len:576 (-),score=174.79 TRINITY_DN3573_c0_g1_i1:79-1806(-)